MGSPLPKIAIIGRPNVGKSALFNRICGRRQAIVDEAEGITRDRLYGQGECFSRSFEVIDTGGIDSQATHAFYNEVERQAEIAMEEADGLIVVVDGHVGPTPLDEAVIKRLHRSGTQKPICLAVNKIDHPSHEALQHQFYGLGVEATFSVSALQDLGIGELLDHLLKKLPEPTGAPSSTGVSLAIVGRPNVGKSTLMNRLIEEERCVVSPIAGTTRDAIDVPCILFGLPYTLIDTAGIRRKRAEKEVVDKFAAIRTEKAIERSDVCILVVDATEGVTTQDKRIASQIAQAGKGCCLWVNKWDQVHHLQMEHAMRKLRQDLPYLRHCPILFGSALSGRNLQALGEAVEEVTEARACRVPTPQLNAFIEQSLQLNHPPLLHDRRLRIYYMTQIAAAPPRFLLFVNAPNLMDRSYERYLLNRFRTQFPFVGNPISFILRGKKRKGLAHSSVGVGS